MPRSLFLERNPFPPTHPKRAKMRGRRAPIDAKTARKILQWKTKLRTCEDPSDKVKLVEDVLVGGNFGDEHHQRLFLTQKGKRWLMLGNQGTAEYFVQTLQVDPPNGEKQNVSADDGKKEEVDVQREEVGNAA